MIAVFQELAAGTGAARPFHSYFVSIVRSNRCKRFDRGPNPGKTNSAFLPSGAVREIQTLPCHRPQAGA